MTPDIRALLLRNSNAVRRPNKRRRRRLKPALLIGGGIALIATALWFLP